MEQLHGVLVLNKPQGMSSAQCTNRLKRLGQKKIGHAGTLDPMARGVLLVLLGQATKLSSYIMSGGTKTYAAEVEFGRSTDTWDNDGQTVSALTKEELFRDVVHNPGFTSVLNEMVRGWIGISEQPVPPYSAAKHEGKPLYKLVREGKTAPEKVKTIEILRAEVLWVELPRASFRIVCSSGTYIRSLAHSLGERLGCGAVLTGLIREYSHPFGLEKAVALDALCENPELLREHLLPVTAALPDWPVLQIAGEYETMVKNGMSLPVSRVRTPEGADLVWSEGLRTVLTTFSGEPLALAEVTVHDGIPSLTVLRGLWT